ncbi:MAG: branched-chain amino acid aminotransferase [Deltaproteobacteria bacterium]|jgi:branched-chain amino acid aminotransferase|nr:branched-chain amino acid aminotransferase [Deltaproteobacteria bacterium]
MEIQIRRQLPKHLKLRPADESALGFGDIFTDHMFKLDYFGGEWRNPRIEPYGPLLMDPSAMVLHYSQTVFEGLKCYRHPDGRLALFRPRDNFRRFSSSAGRMAIPPFDEELVLRGLKELLKVDGSWTPSREGSTLYIRPTIIATEPHLGVRPAKEYLLYVIMGPVGPYYPEGFAPVKIYVEPHYTRVAPGGLGCVKAGASYGGSLLATELAARKGYTQLLWLDAISHKFVEEVGSMNMFFVVDGAIVTPPLSGTILPGITRSSVLTVAGDLGIRAEEKSLSVEELLETQKNGRLTECFGSGTACVISPVGHLSYTDETFQIGTGGIGPITQKLYDELVGVQFGTLPDKRGWVEFVE